MNTIIVKRLRCFQSEDVFGDEIKLRIRADDHYGVTLRKGDFDNDEVWEINRSYTFEDTITLMIYDEDNDLLGDSDDKLGAHIFDDRVSMYDATASFTRYEADYELIFDLVVEADSPNQFEPTMGRISFRHFFSRMGRGLMDVNQHQQRILDQKIYQIGNEVISLRHILDRNDPQDRGKGATNFIREWINTHCNFFSAKTYHSNKPEVDKSDVFFYGKNWKTVLGELTHEVAGFQEYSRVTSLDNPTSHQTRDWNWDLFPDPQFMYLLGEGMKAKGHGNELVPVLHNEWETGSFPIEWRPFWGEYVTFWGRHVWDLGHAPVVTEIHPAHAMVRENTTASAIGNNNTMVPVNQAIVGMGLSGGFTTASNSRWFREFSTVPDELTDDSKECWPTNLKKRPLKFKLYPPVERPSATATLEFNIKLCESISVKNYTELNDFLELAQQDNPNSSNGRAFRIWNKTKGYPPQTTGAAFQPTFTLVNALDGQPAFFDVEIDLSTMPDIPVGYYAILECGWSELGNHQLKQYEITFEKIHHHALNFTPFEWHLYYGVNGYWNAFWGSFSTNKKILCWVLDDMPLAIRGSGVEWYGRDWYNKKLNDIGIVARGLDHLADLKVQIAQSNYKNLIEESTTSNNEFIRFNITGKGDPSSYTWTVKVALKNSINESS